MVLSDEAQKEKLKHIMRVNQEKYRRLGSNYQTAAVFKNVHAGKTILILGTGTSTSLAIPHKYNLKKHFDIIIGINFATKEFEDQMDYHIVMEHTPVPIYTDMFKRKHRKDLPRILNCTCLKSFPQYLNIIKSTRYGFNDNPHPRKYTKDDGEGLFSGYNNIAHSTAIQAIHLACIMGCDNIYLIGIEMMFKDKFDHFYKDRLYRNRPKHLSKASTHTIINVDVDDKKYESIQFFKNSAEDIDRFIASACRPMGINIYDFSEGLLKEPIKLDFDKFMDKE